MSAHEYRCLRRPEAFNPSGARVTGGCKPADKEALGTSARAVDSLNH